MRESFPNVEMCACCLLQGNTWSAGPSKLKRVGSSPHIAGERHPETGLQANSLFCVELEGALRRTLRSIQSQLNPIHVVTSSKFIQRATILSRVGKECSLLERCFVVFFSSFPSHCSPMPPCSLWLQGEQQNARAVCCVISSTVGRMETVRTNRLHMFKRKKLNSMV
jgi:hypothetical protein